MKRMPVEGCPSIPWHLIAPHEQQAIRNHRQSLERLRQRGGLDAGEARLIIEGRSLREHRDLNQEESKQWVRDLVANDETAALRAQLAQAQQSAERARAELLEEALDAALDLVTKATEWEARRLADERDTERQRRQALCDAIDGRFITWDAGGESDEVRIATLGAVADKLAALRRQLVNERQRRQEAEEQRDAAQQEAADLREAQAPLWEQGIRNLGRLTAALEDGSPPSSAALEAARIAVANADEARDAALTQVAALVRDVKALVFASGPLDDFAPSVLKYEAAEQAVRDTIANAADLQAAARAHDEALVQRVVDHFDRHFGFMLPDDVKPSVVPAVLDPTPEGGDGG
ncbi:MAG: hypothetical protein B7733_00160 [Myxococcales bacterium FL481]|nr:MAG: hypothetical protein B7733_00160 [Myxococcales bacterium FL481]